MLEDSGGPVLRRESSLMLGHGVRSGIHPRYDVSVVVSGRSPWLRSELSFAWRFCY